MHSTGLSTSANPTGERGRRRLLAAMAAVVALALGPGAVPAAAECPEKNPSYTGACGPTFVLPGWGDAGGWTDPEQYETIQLADVDGDGADELLGRTPTGLAIHNFDTALGHWRPQVDDKDRPIVLTAFADPPPLSSVNAPGSGPWWNAGGYPPKTDWTLPQYYDTIQAADIDGDKREEVLARGVDGLMVFKFTPVGDPKAGKGSWKQLATSWQFRDSDHWGDHPSYYTTIGTGDLDGNGDAEVFARGSAGPTVLDWNGSSWRTVANITEILRDDHNGKEPAYYTSLQAANVAGDKRDELIARDENGVAMYQFDPGTWEATLLNRPLDKRRFSDRSRAPDCPFYSGGPCLGTAPAYYGTLQFADFDGNGREELIGRSDGGVRQYPWRSGGYVIGLAPLTDLGNGNGYGDQKQWETIQFADIDGDRKAEALARDKASLNAWSHVSYLQGWTKLAPKTPLALADDPWGSDRSYYSTIQAGDVDGDGRDDVIGRGPYGIRTWFYDRRGTGGWESYLPYGYPDFSCHPANAPSSCQQAAYAMLNSLARSHGYLTAAQDEIRDVWTDVNEPSADLRALMSNLAAIAGCPANNDAFPQYQSCRLPDGASGFTAADWTDVVNRIVAELYHATVVLAHFNHPDNGIKALWKELFLDQLSQLTAIAQQLKLEAAEDITAEFDGKELFSGGLGITGALLALVPGGEPFAAAFEIGAEAVSMIPSASESLTNEFDSKLSSLDTEFATGISEANQAFRDHSQIIRQDAGLLTLVGQLRTRGTLTLDPAAISSAGQQGFSVWVYKTLLPTISARFVITSCYTRSVGDNCEQPNTSRARVGEPGVAKGVDSPGFELISPRPDWSTLCVGDWTWECKYHAVSDEIADKLWGPVSDICAYDGTTNSAAWTFGRCDVGVDPLKSVVPSPIDSQTWDFPTSYGDFNVYRPGSVAATGSARFVAGRGAALRLSGTVRLRRPIRLRGARVKVGRLLHEPRGARELASAGRGRRPLTLSPRAGAGEGKLGFSSRRHRGQRVRLRLRGRSPRTLAFTLRASGRRVSLADACSGTRRGVDLADNPIPLHTRLRIRDGRGRRHVLSLVPQWHCKTNRRGAVHRLVVRQPRTLTPSRGGLAVRVRGPRRVTAGGRATYWIKVSNRRSTTAYDLRVHALLPRGITAARRGSRFAVWHRARLRPGQSKRFKLRARIPHTAAGKARLKVAAQAIDTRSARRRFTTRIRAATG